MNMTDEMVDAAYDAFNDRYDGVSHPRDAIRAALESVAPSEDSVQRDYEHFLAYSGLAGTPVVRYAYFHGADIGLDRPPSGGGSGGLPAKWRAEADLIGDKDATDEGHASGMRACADELEADLREHEGNKPEGTQLAGDGGRHVEVLREMLNDHLNSGYTPEWLREKIAALDAAISNATGGQP